MELLIDIGQLAKLKLKDLVPCKCFFCQTTFNATVKDVRATIANEKVNKKSRARFCSKNCGNASRVQKVTQPCAQCGELVSKIPSEVSASGRAFCNRSCAVTYNNLHKTKGNRRSKLEAWLEEKLYVLYPNLIIEYCNKAAINGELDIYIPSLRLAFELNGIYHYEPIHGQGKLNQVQSNDHRKFQACIEHGIELVIMDTSQLKYFKEANCLPYLDIIRKIIDIKL